MTDDEIAAIDPEHTPTADELALLTGFLDYYRAVMVRKAEGLTREQLATRLGPSEMTLGGSSSISPSPRTSGSTTACSPTTVANRG